MPTMNSIATEAFASHSEPQDPCAQKIPRKTTSCTYIIDPPPLSPSSDHEKAVDLVMNAPNSNHHASPTAPMPHQPSAQAGILLSLPPGVTIPPAMDASILLTSERALTLLQQLTPPQIQAALMEFVEAMKNKGDRVRNSQAYLVGVIKRYIAVVQKETANGGNAGLTLGHEITPVVKNCLHKLISTGFCSPNDLNDKVMGKLRMLSERDALLAIDEISGCQRDKIRNFSSYFMGILNRYMRGEDTPHKHQQVSNGNRYDVDRRRSHDHRGGGSSRHSRDDDRYRRSRSRSRSRSPSDRRRRSRSDSSYEDRKYRRKGDRYRDSDDDASRSSSDYDRDYDRRRRDRDRSRSRDRYESRRDRDRYDRDRDRDRRRSSYRDRSRSPEYRRDRDRHSSRRRSDRSDKDRRNGSGSGLPKSPGLPLPGMAPPYQHAVGGIPPPPPPPPPAPGAFNPSMQHPQTFNHNIPSQGGPGFSHPSFGEQQGHNFGNTPMMPHNNMAPPTDILGIAEKAASAVQALTAQNMNRQASQQQHMNPNMGQQQQNSYHPHTPGFYGQDASVNDLGEMVQFAIKNLQATGHLESKELGSTACRLLKQLPQPVALQQLEKFSSCDASIMRSKEGYLVGILKKALDKL